MFDSNYLLKHINDQLSKKLPASVHELFEKIRKAFSQPAVICSKLTIETLQQGVKYVQS